MSKCKLLALLLCSLLLITPLTGFADYTEFVRSSTTLGEITHYNLGESSNGEIFRLLYSGAPAGKDGEIDSFTVTKSYGGSISGSAQISRKDIQLILGINVETSIAFTISKTSAPLAAGEYIMAYWQKNYDKNKFTRDQTTRGMAVDFDDNGNPISGEYYTEVTETLTTYAYEPIMPKIQLIYYQPTSTNTQSSSYSFDNTQQYRKYRVEEYTYIDGSYVCTKTTVY